MARGYECAAHKHQVLVPQEKHHVWPLGYHGPRTTDNLVLVCSNAHSDIHYLLEELLKGRDVDLRLYGIGVRMYAHRGYDQVMAYGGAASVARGR